MPKKLPSCVVGRIDRLLDEGKTTTEILDELGDDAPDERTIRRRRERRASEDPRAIWSLGHATAAEASCVPRVLAAAIEHTEGRTRSVTNHEARLIANVASAAPDVDPFEVYRVAREYIAASKDQAADLARSLDMYLACAPWRGDEARERYLQGMEKGWHAVFADPDEVIARQAARVAAIVKEARRGKKSAR